MITDQFIDFTKNRKLTFYEEDENGVVHTDFTTPYCLNQGTFKTKLNNKGIFFAERGTYICRGTTL